MKKKGLQKENERLEETLFAFRSKLSDILRQEAENLRCPISQIDALSYVAQKENPSMKEIADHLKITPPSATAIIEILQKKKLIHRVVNDKDRRKIRITLTPKAWIFFKSFQEHKFAIFTKMFSKLDSDDRKQFIRILNILIKE